MIGRLNLFDVAAGRGDDAAPQYDAGRLAWSAIRPDVIIGRTRSQSCRRELMVQSSHRKLTATTQHLLDAWWLIAAANFSAWASFLSLPAAHTPNCIFLCISTTTLIWFVATYCGFQILKTRGLRTMFSLSFLFASFSQTLLLAQAQSLLVGMVSFALAILAANLTLMSYSIFSCQVVGMADRSEFLMSRPVFLFGSGIGFCLAAMNARSSFHQGILLMGGLGLLHFTLTVSIVFADLSATDTTSNSLHLRQVNWVVVGGNFVYCFGLFTAGCVYVGCFASTMFLHRVLCAQTEHLFFAIGTLAICSSLCCIPSASVIHYAAQDNESFIMTVCVLAFLCWPLMFISLQQTAGVATMSGLFVYSVAATLTLTSTNVLWNLGLTLLANQVDGSYKGLPSAVVISTFCGAALSVAMLQALGTSLFLLLLAMWLLAFAVVVASAACMIKPCAQPHLDNNC